MSTLPEPPWSTRRPRSSKPVLTRELIADAALRIVDSDGLDGLNMRRLAEDLGTGAASLYAHVSGKEELLLLLIDRAAGEMPLPAVDAEHWQDQLKTLARSIFTVFVSHRDLARASLATIPTGPAVAEVTERMLAILQSGGLQPQVVAYAADVIPLYIAATAYETSMWAQRMERGDGDGYFSGIRAYFEALPVDRFPVLTGLVPELMNQGEDEHSRFEFGLDMLVRGIASTLAQPSASVPPSPRPS